MINTIAFIGSDKTKQTPFLLNRKLRKLFWRKSTIIGIICENLHEKHIFQHRYYGNWTNSTAFERWKKCCWRCEIHVTASLSAITKDGIRNFFFVLPNLVVNCMWISWETYNICRTPMKKWSYFCGIRKMFASKLID